jgi:hypothetical protein
MRFHSVVELGGRTATGIPVPNEVIEALGSGRRPPVTITINGYTYRTTAVRMGGRFLVPLSAENREAAGVTAGEEITVEIENDAAPREVMLPDVRRARVHPSQGVGAVGRGGEEARDTDGQDRQDRGGPPRGAKDALTRGRLVLG